MQPTLRPAARRRRASSPRGDTARVTVCLPSSLRAYHLLVESSGSHRLEQHAYRVSDADREQVAELLRQAAGEGRLDIDELEERLEQTYAAKTYAQLEPITHDLPVHGAQRPAAPARPQPSTHPARVGGVPTAMSSIAIFGGSQRKGVWVVPESFTAFAMCGGVELDLREATMAAHEVTITAVAIMGGVDIVAPDDVHVVVDGAGILGGFDDNANRAAAVPPGAPILRVRGVALLGGVNVKRRPARRTR